jgi:RNA polymerase sigma-70 factor (ECF subfamily)
MDSLRRDAPLYFSPDSLLAERPRLVRYCARFTHDGDAAEDLAQETLVTAWETRERLREYDSYQAYLTGVARNICLRFLRRQSAERRRVASAESLPNLFSADDLPDNSLPDMDELLERHEVERLIDRALRALPRKTHELLIDRYVYGLSLAYIADKRGIREETAAVHLHRSRRALHKRLLTPDFVAEAQALGIIEREKDQRRETSIWCPKCGQRRLRGFLGACLKHQDVTEFFLGCPTCDQDGDCFLFMHFTPGQPNATLLEGVKGIKPALKRTDRWWNDFITGTIRRGMVACFHCGHRQPYRTAFPADYFEKPLANHHGLWTTCEKCSWKFHISAEQIGLIQPEGAAFWRNNPRLIMRPAQVRPSANGPLIVSRLESVTGRGFIEFARSARTMELLEITEK